MPTRWVLALFITISAVRCQITGVAQTWIAGTNLTNAYRTAATVGVPSTDIYPGARRSHCLAITTGDINYSVYVYGGYGYTLSTGPSALKDFWRYDMASSQWTMLPENSASTPKYGTVAVESPSVFPGSLSAPVCAMNPLDNCIYLFGGISATLYNDVWRYNTASGYWTFLTGGTSTTTPELGVESPTIFPIPRKASGAVIYPALNSLYIFGGLAQTSGSQEQLNDLWRYNIDTNAWTWLAGNYSTVKVLGSYGIVGQSNPTNYPHNRAEHGMTINGTAGTIFIYGGQTTIGTTTSTLNDLWSYDISTGAWLWLSGSSAIKATAVKGSAYQFDSTFTPGSRLAPALSAIPYSTYLIVVGGYGYGVTNILNANTLNEIWAFDTANGQWAWLINSQEAAVYGVRGVNSAGSRMPPRFYVSAGALVYDSTILVHSGYFANTLNDLWRLDFTGPALLPLRTLQAASTSSSLVLSTSVPLPISIATDMTTSTLPDATTSPTDTTMETLMSSPMTAISESSPAAKLATSTTSFTGLSMEIVLISAAAGVLVVFALVSIIVCAVVRSRSGKPTIDMVDAPIPLNKPVKGPIPSPQNTISISATSTPPTTDAINTLRIQTLEYPQYSNPSKSLLVQFGRDFRTTQLVFNDTLGETYIGEALIPALQMYGTVVYIHVVTDEFTFKNELGVLTMLRGKSPNLELLLGWSDTPMTMVLKNCTQSTLKHWLSVRGIQTKELKLGFWADICRGLQCMHSYSLTHCDIRPENINVDINTSGQPVCVLGGMRAARLFTKNGKLYSNPTTYEDLPLFICYSAPELLEHHKHPKTLSASRQIDIYAMAMIGYELLENSVAWE